MAFQSNVFRNGRWVTETVNLHDARLKATAPPKPAVIPRPSHQDPPECAILSRTIIEAPAVHYVLPVRLRSKAHNDIAFIGDRYVQISELRADGQVHEIIRKSDFDVRIRNAVVFGNHPVLDDREDDTSSSIKDEDSDVFMHDSENSSEKHQPTTLPPQLLILMLETGDIVFLFVRQCGDGKREFVASRWKGPETLRYLGYQLAIDPSSRYIAASSNDKAFIVYELETVEALNKQYREHGYLQPIISFYLRTVNAVIHKLEFLHPRPEDKNFHTILVLILIQEVDDDESVARMITYDWDAGGELSTVLQDIKPGTRIPDEHRMPLLLIPLRFKTAFFAVSRDCIGIVKCTLSGSPEFEVLRTDAPGSTELHHGHHNPLWAAWARPFRRTQYLTQTDVIYLAREDGVMVHIEIDAVDLLPSVTNVGGLDTNITTAFTTAFDTFSDVLIIGGDSGPGGIWKLPPRSDLQQVATIPNWSPAVDFMTTDGHRRKVESQPCSKTSRNERRTVKFHKPDRLFCTSGRGPKSSVTELRWGTQARVGLDIDFDQPARHSWIFPTQIQDQNAFYALLSLPHSTEALQFSEDLGQADAVSPETSPFDINSRTLCAVQIEQGIIVQISETSTNLIAPSQSSRHPHESACDLSSQTVDHAFCQDQIVVLSTHGVARQQLVILRIDEMNVKKTSAWDVATVITCISLFEISGDMFIVAGSVLDGSPLILIYSLDGREIASATVKIDEESVGEVYGEIEAFTSICVLNSGEPDSALITLGARSGHLVTSRIRGTGGHEHISFSVERLGMAPANVFPASGHFDSKIAAFACCDNQLILLTDFSQRTTAFKAKISVWPTDVNDPSMPAPPIHSVFCLEESLSGYPGHMSLMLLSGTRILLADIWPHFGPVPRSIPLEGTPTRIIYSTVWKCLVVAHSKNNRPTLSFIDPDSGATISSPSSSDRQPVDFISGFGVQGDTVLGLYEWRFTRDGMTFPFIIVTTKKGRLLIVSVQETHIQTGNGSVRNLLYWTRYKKKEFRCPIYSVIGGPEGLFFCAGHVLHWEVLDLKDKKLRPMGELTLESPATSLRLGDGKVVALTAAHSLQVIDLDLESPTTNMSIVHTDQVTRIANHLIDVGDSAETPGEWPLTLVSTNSGGLVGLWIPRDQRNRPLHIRFHGKLPASVRRFRRGHIRPPWTAVWGKKYGRLASSIDDPDTETLGACVDGSLQQFTLVRLELWRVLRLIQNLAQCSPAICPFTQRHVPDDLIWSLEPKPEADTLYINGDILKRCLEVQALEDLLSRGNGFGLGRFCEYLDALEDGIHTARFDKSSDDGRKKYLELGYDILEYILAPLF